MQHQCTRHSCQCLAATVSGCNHSVVLAEHSSYAALPWGSVISPSHWESFLPPFLPSGHLKSISSAPGDLCKLELSLGFVCALCQFLAVYVYSFSLSHSRSYSPLVCFSWLNLMASSSLRPPPFSWPLVSYSQ